MVSANLIILKIILFTVLTNGQSENPFFICQRRDDHMESYDIVLDHNDQMVIANCTDATIIATIIDHLYESRLGTILTIHFNSSILHQIPRLRNTTDLDLSSNNLAEIDLREYHQLEELNLTSNRIRSLAAIKLANVTLNSLDMSRNRLLKFEHLLLPSVRRLYLRSNNLFELPSNISLPEALEVLDLTRNEIENVTDVIMHSETLRVLNLSINLINAFTSSVIEHLPNLEVLVLECNKILELMPGTFSKNSKLTELNLRDNNLSTIKKGVFEKLKNLKSLDISKNNLLQLTPEILQNLNNLMDFSVSENNKLCQYACKRNLEFLLILGGRLRTLKMNNLRMSKFPVTLTTSIRHLDLSKNKLTSVQLGSLENFPHLRTLILTKNEIESVEAQVFCSMEHLEVLRLDYNRLKKVPSSLASSLIELRLDHNEISRLKNTSFGALQNLQVLNLAWNSIEIVDSGSMMPLRNLITLDISNNPILTLTTSSWEGLFNLRTLVAANLPNADVANASSVRCFPVSELPNLRTLNLTASPTLAHFFTMDLPLLATVTQLETLDLSYSNLNSSLDRISNYLPRLRVARARGNRVNCSASWFGSREYDYRELSVDRTNYRLKVRLRRDTAVDFTHSGRDCAYVNFALRNVSAQQFWSNVNRTRAAWKPPSTTAASAVRFLPSDALTTPSNYIHNSSLTTQHPSVVRENAPSTPSTYPATRYHVQQTTRKKLNTRSLHRAAQFSQRNGGANQINGSRLSTTATSFFPTIQIKLPSGSAGAATVTGITTSLPVTSALSTLDTQFEPATLNVTFLNTSTSTTSQLPSTAAKLPTIAPNYSLAKLSPSSSAPLSPDTSQTISLTVSSAIPSPPSPPPRIDEKKSSTASPSSFFATFAGSVVASRNFHPSTNSTEGHYEPLIWNRTNEYASFFDWFPGQNDSSVDADLAERSIKAQQDSDIQYTHPGLVIFSAITCFLLVIFVSLVAPPYVQKYRWRRKRYKMSQFDNECQRSIEISSISAFVETEIPLE